MDKIFKNVPGSLNSLLVLEAAVRRGTFTAAAQELGISQPSVSRHISVLEGRLGQHLFVRENNQLRPTKSGLHLAGAVALGMGHMENAWADLLQKKSKEEIVIASSFGFSELWLMPRFRTLRTAVDGTTIKIATTDRMESLNFDEVDIAVVWDTSFSPDRPFIPLFDEVIVPVCSPEYLENNRDVLKSVESLAHADLLYFDPLTSGARMNWEKWFSHFDVAFSEPADAYYFDALPFVTDAARNGEGVALAWENLVTHSIERGDLIAVGPPVRSGVTSYFLQYRSSALKDPKLQQVIQWFKETADAP